MPVPVDRIIKKEDEYLSKNDYAGAKRHLLYWWDEAEAENDDRGKLLLCNELMGLFRKTGIADEAKKYAVEAVELVKKLDLSETVSGATAFLNCGTVYKAFGEPEKSLKHFEMAKAIYEKLLESGDSRLAGLYNNMALTLLDLRRFDEANRLFRLAIDIVKSKNKGDEAITWLNLADLTAMEKGMTEAESEIFEYLDKAVTLLDEVPDEERDSYYAYVCEKCAPVFDYYGYFMAAKECRERSEEITRRYQNAGIGNSKKIL